MTANDVMTVSHKSEMLAEMKILCEPRNVKPETVSCNYDAIPEELRQLQAWMIWKYQLRKGIWSKEPFIAEELPSHARTNDPSTWREFPIALRFATSSGNGLGMRFVAPYCGIDLDCCRNKETGQILPWAQVLIARFDSYTEVSPSGEGVHIILRLARELPTGNRKRGGKDKGWEIGIYDATSPRYFCMTGAFVDGHTNIRTLDPADFYDDFAAGSLDPELSKAGKSNGHAEQAKTSTSKETHPCDDQGNKFERLMQGHWQDLGYKSESEADFALCVLLGKYTNGSAPIIDRIFRTSGLFDEKWDRRDGPFGTYGARTIEHALREVRKSGGPAADLAFRKPAKSASKRRYVIEPLDTYDGWFRLGGIHAIGGSSGAGKSTLVLDMLDKQADGIDFLGHKTARLRFLMCSADRPLASVRETLDRMRLADRIPSVHLDNKIGFDAVVGILSAIEDHEVPEIVFIEGADALVEDPIKVQGVAPFLRLLQTIAQHYNLAVILSVGAPKTKAGEGYVLARDKIFGSQVWPRMSETIVYVSETADGAREVNVQHRNAKAEHFDLQFVEGRLVLRDAVSDEQARLERNFLWQWITKRRDCWFSRKEALRAMTDADAGMDRSTVYRNIQKWLDKNLLETDLAGSGEEHLRRRQS